MVLSFKFNLNQTRRFHTFHFKFKRLLSSSDRSSEQLRRLTKRPPNFLSETASKRTLFNIGNQFCRMSSINPIVIEPSSTHKTTLFFFHGLGDTGHGWSDYWQCLGVNQNLKIVLPTANSIKVTLNMGMKMPSWFDIYGLSEDSKEDEEGIKKASEYVHGLIEEEISKTGISSDKILLGGFSMGAALAIYSAFTYPKKLAGVIVYSGWLPLHKSFTESTVPANQQIKILQAHGDADFVVPLKWGQMSRDYIQKALKNENIVFKVYPNMGHAGCTEETRDTKEFLNNLLPTL